MSRDLTPKEMLLIEKTMLQNGGTSLWDIMKHTTVTIASNETPMYSEEELAHREKYPLLGKLLNQFHELYYALALKDGGFALLAAYEKELEDYVASGNGNADSPVIQWYEGKLDKHFYYSEINEDLLIGHLLSGIGLNLDDMSEKGLLFAVLEKEIPYRMEELYGIPLTEKMTEALVDYAYENPNLLFDHDLLDHKLGEKQEELVKAQFQTFDGMISHLCEVRSRWEGRGITQSSEKYVPVFESEHYFGVYSQSRHEHYLIAKTTGSYDLLMDESPNMSKAGNLDKVKYDHDFQIADSVLLRDLVDKVKAVVHACSEQLKADCSIQLQFPSIAILETALVEQLGHLEMKRSLEQTIGDAAVRTFEGKDASVRKDNEPER